MLDLGMMGAKTWKGLCECSGKGGLRGNRWHFLHLTVLFYPFGQDSVKSCFNIKECVKIKIMFRNTVHQISYQDSLRLKVQVQVQFSARFSKRWSVTWSARQQKTITTEWWRHRSDDVIEMEKRRVRDVPERNCSRRTAYSPTASKHFPVMISSKLPSTVCTLVQIATSS